MKTKLLIVVFLFNIVGLFAQKNSDTEIRIKSNILDKENADIDTLFDIKGKKIIFDFDTLFIINQIAINEYIYCIGKLQEYKSLTGPLDNLTKNINGIHLNVDSVYKNLKTLNVFIDDFKINNEKKLDLLSSENKKLSDLNLDMTKQLDEAKNKIKNEQWNNLGRKLVWGLGGFAAGVILVAIIK